MEKLRNLDDILEECLYAISDLLDEDNLDLLSAAGTGAIFRQRYNHGDCDLLAHALHETFGWKVVSIVCDEGLLHRLVMDNKGRMVDASGFVSESKLLRRYGLENMTVNVGGPELLMSAINEDFKDTTTLEMVLHIRYAPFNGVRFQSAIKNKLSEWQDHNKLDFFPASENSFSARPSPP